MPKVSVFTPSHNPVYLQQAYASMLAQTFTDWEWIILLNGDAPLLLQGINDARVKIVHIGEVNGVGHAKKLAVGLCTGEILVELDHDDALAPDALESIVGAFKDHPDAGMVYSRFRQIREDGSPHPLKFGAEYGWTYEKNLVPKLFEPTPHNVSLIWFAPNHVRAFTRKAYDKTLGYDSYLRILDDLDLMAKLYRVGEFIPIHKMLYLQRLHKDNTQFKLNDDIQTQTWEHYEKNIFTAAQIWSVRNGLDTRFNLLDRVDYGDLCGTEDSSVGFVRTFEMEHLPNPMSSLLKIHAKLAPNGLFLSETPYWGDAIFKRFTEGPCPLFQVSRMRTFWRDNRPYVQANLIAIKHGYTREGGILG